MSRRTLTGYHDPWQVAMLEDLNDMIDLLSSMNYLLSVSTGNVRVAVQLTLSFILTDTAHFFKPGEAIVFSDLQTLSATVGGIDAGGNPTLLDPTIVPNWAVSDPGILKVVPAPDGKSAIIKFGTKLGTANVLVSVPNQSLPQPVQAQITVTASKAVELDLTFGKPH